jgi:hypothetical protein
MCSTELKNLRGQTELDRRILTLISGEDCELDELARDIYSWQVTHCPEYRRFCEQRGAHKVDGWRTVPAIPIDAFKEFDLRSFPEQRTVATFQTSGTTTGARGRHHLDELQLYREGSMLSFGAALVPDGRRLPIVSLIESVDRTRDSSLAQMVSWAVEQFGDADSEASPTGEAILDREGPLLVLGTSLALLSFFDRHPGVQLPKETRIMETGGFKGATTQTTRFDLHQLYQRAGVDLLNVVGEYGMTELSSQWYDGRVGEAEMDLDKRVYVPPPWARTRVLDPSTLDDVSYGETGLLMHFDPLNRGSVQAILTGDLGVRCPGLTDRDGFRYVGRAPEAQVRGCSLRFEELSL